MDFCSIPEIVKMEKSSFLNEEYNKKVDLINIIYRSDDIHVHGYILMKKKLTKQIPVIIFCRGGNNKPGRLGEISPRFIAYRKEFIYMVENEKAIIFFPNYRGSSFSEGDDEFGGKDVNDIINLYSIISKYKYCDSTKIGLYGWSRGGMMAIIVATKVDWVKTIILGASVYSMSRNVKERPEMGEMWEKLFHLTKEDFRTRAPKYLMDRIPKNISILILHGSNDKAVPVSHGYSLGINCQRNKLLYKLIIYPNGDHGLSEYMDDVMEEVIKWIDRSLGSFK